MKMSILFILLAPPFTRPSPNGPSPSSPSSQQCNSSAKDTTGTILSRSSVERGFHFPFSFVPLHLLTTSCDPVNPHTLFPISPQSSTVYTLQRRVRVLREQVQRRDLHLELLRRKIALLEDGSRGKIALQAERDDAVQRARRCTKAAERAQQQLIEVKSQLSEVKGQLSEAADHKISALERARKVDELQSRIIDVENEKCKLISQLASYKSRARSAVENANDKRCRDEQAICVSGERWEQKVSLTYRPCPRSLFRPFARRLSGSKRH